MPGKSFVMAFVWSGWLIASVIAFMIVAYAGFLTFTADCAGDAGAAEAAHRD